MQTKISLVPYAVRLKDVNEHAYVRLDRLNKGLSLQKLMEDFLASVRSTIILPESKSGIRSDYHVVRGDIIDGLLLSGGYGQGAELENIRTQAKYNRTPDDLELSPFYFLLQTKPKQNEAVLILHKQGSFGVKTVLQPSFGDYIERQLPDIRLEINPLVNRNFLEKAIMAGAKKLHFIRYSIPADTASDIGIEDHKEHKGLMQLTVKVKDHRLSLGGWKIGEVDNSSIIEINGVDYTNVKAEVEIEGVTKTVNLGKPDSLKMAFDITESVQIGKNGHPKFENLRTEAETLLPLITKAIRWESDNAGKN